MDWQNASVLITGGTGSFGRKLVEYLLKNYPPRRLIIFSRDEVKQLEMRQFFPDGEGSPLRFFLGDIRDRQRVYRAFRGVDVVVHAAALKQVPTAEYNPLEFIHTNVMGAVNIIDAAVDCGVKKVISLSTDKAVNPINLYGATKLCAEKLFTGAGVYAGDNDTRFASVRYGNVMGSRGSVIPYFLKQRATGVLTITDPCMTRFWITLEQAVAFVFQCISIMDGGEIFVPKLPSMRVTDLAAAIGPECRQEIIGIRPGEKLHEVLLMEDEARYTLEFEDFFVVSPGPVLGRWTNGRLREGRRLPQGFQYKSDTNEWWLDHRELARMVGLDEAVPFPASGSGDALEAGIGAAH